MCWCRPQVKTPWCEEGPCNQKEIGELTEWLDKNFPDLDRSIKDGVRTAYAKDMDGWRERQEWIEKASEYGRNAGACRDRMILNALKGVNPS